MTGPRASRAPSGAFDQRKNFVLPSVHGLPLGVHLFHVKDLRSKAQGSGISSLKVSIPRTIPAGRRD